MQFVAGVDCHKDTHTVIFLDGRGQVVRHLTIKTTEIGYKRAMDAARAIGEVTWGLEGTGTYGRGFARALVTAGMLVFEVPGVLTKRHRKHASSHGKSDENDARAIAEAVLREHGRLPRFQEIEEQEALRLRYDQRDHLVRERTMLVNRLRHSILRLGLTLPTQLRSGLSLQRLAKQIESIQEPGLMEQAILDEMRFNLATIERLDVQIAHLERVIRPFVKKVAPELLEIHGVSDIVAAGLVGHCGNIANIRDADAFAMRSATAPVSCSSGRNTSVRVNTGGNRQLNRLLHIIALIQVRSAKHRGRVYYDRKRQEGKTHLAAMRALKRRLATVVFLRLRLTQSRMSPITPRRVA